jgi:hypothetical protein
MICWHGRMYNFKLHITILLELLHFSFPLGPTYKREKKKVKFLIPCTLFQWFCFYLFRVYTLFSTWLILALIRDAIASHSMSFVHDTWTLIYYYYSFSYFTPFVCACTWVFLILIHYYIVRSLVHYTTSIIQFWLHTYYINNFWWCISVYNSFLLLVCFVMTFSLINYNTTRF